MLLRIPSAALALLLFLTSTSASTTLVDSTGALTRITVPQTSIGTGIVTIVSSPGTPSHFPTSDGGVVLSTREDGVSILTSPGATLTGASALSKGSGAVAAAAVSGSIILSGITESDLENGLDDTRHGHTLTAIFKQRLQEGGGEEEEQTVLIITVPPSADEETVRNDVNSIFETASMEVGSDASLQDLYKLSIEKVASETDAERVLQMASEAAKETKVMSNVSSTIADVYTRISSSASAESSPTATAALLACDDSFARHHKSVRAKVSSWKSRTGRGLTVDNFGTAASQLMKRTMESFDRDTMSAAGIVGSVASYRLQVRAKLQARMESAIRELFQIQVELLEKSTLKKFNAMLLRKHGGGTEGTEKFYNDNAAAVRSAAFAFDQAVEDLEVPSLALTKSKVSQEMSNKLNTALLTFPDSPAAKLKDMKKVTKVVSKQKQPTQRSVDVGIDLVAMIRPDGFGNLQGFGGYQLGGNNIIVGIHNDADEPGVIAQFGGKRPPFLRVQPKLKVDIEL